MSRQPEINTGKLGVALVGLGYYATNELAPALQLTAGCYLAGIVTGSPEKAAEWQQKYKIPVENSYDYSRFDEIAGNPSIDIIYITLPNALHAEYVTRAARAGKHVICEKPMALHVTDCDSMIAACNNAGTKLSIGYRLHFDPYNLEMCRLAREKTFGNIKKIQTGFGFIAEPGIWRLDKNMAGGGPLQDLGIYCIQGACYLLGMNPVAVTAQEGTKHDTAKFSSVEESLSWQMEFPDGTIAECRSSYNEEYCYLRAEADNGWFELSPAFEYRGLKGQTSNGPLNFPEINQQAAQMDAFAQAVKQDQLSSVPGEMGRRDVKIIEAVYKAMRTGERVNIEY